MRMRKAELHMELGVSRPTLDKYLSLENAPQPDDKKEYDVDEVRVFIGGLSKRDHVAAVASESLFALKEREMRIKCERAEHALAVQKGKYLPVDKVKELYARYVFKAKGALIGGQNALVLKLCAVTGAPPEKVLPKVQERDIEFLRELESCEYTPN